MCACFLKREFCHLLSNVSFLILTSAGSLILAFLASLTMKRTQKRQCFLSMNLPADHRSVIVVKMHSTCKPTPGLDTVEETLEQPHRKDQLHGFWWSHCFFVLPCGSPLFHDFSRPYKLYDHTESLEVVCSVSVFFFSFLFFFRCVTLIETSVYSLHSSYFSFNIVTGPSKANNI